MSSAINTLHYPYTGLAMLDPDGGMQHALGELKKTKLAALSDDDVKEIAEVEFFKLNDENRKTSEKKSYENKTYGQEIFLQSMLEEIDMYLDYWDIVEHQLEQFRERYEDFLKQESRNDEFAKLAIQNSIKAIFQSNLKKVPLNQIQEVLTQKILQRIDTLNVAIDQLTKKIEKEWGANTWEGGLQQLVGNVSEYLVKRDIFGGKLSAEELEACKDIVANKKKNIIEALAHRPAELDVHKRVTQSHTLFSHPSQTESLTTPVPIAPTLDKVYAPTLKQVFTQYEVDTEVLICSNIVDAHKEMYKKTGKTSEQPIIRVSAEITKEIMDKDIRSQYIKPIHEHTEDLIRKENMLRLKQKATHILEMLKSDVQSLIPKKP